jgi:hypothetical protein
MSRQSLSVFGTYLFTEKRTLKAATITEYLRTEYTGDENRKYITLIYMNVARGRPVQSTSGLK